KKTLAQRIGVALEGAVKTLAAKAQHFHIADHEVVGFASCAVESLRAVEDDVDAHAFVLENVGNELRHRRFILDHQDTRAFISFEGGGPRIGKTQERDRFRSRALSLVRTRALRFLLLTLGSHRKLDLKERAALQRSLETHLSSVLADDSQDNNQTQ